MTYRIILFLTISLVYTSTTKAQEQAMPTLPYHQIESYPENYAPGNIMSRFIDGLGYRYYWASEGLTETDLAYKPSIDARSSLETIDHIYDLSLSILNIAENRINVHPNPNPYTSYEELRSQTLLNLKAASEAFANKTEAELSKITIRKSDAEDASSFPLWNAMNGQISDAIYHTGQLASFRRTTGNPINTNVNVFIGKNR